MLTSRRAPREQPVAPFLCGQRRGHFLRRRQNCGRAEEMQKDITVAPDQLTGSRHPMGVLCLCAVAVRARTFWGTFVWGFAIPASLQFGNQLCSKGNLTFSVFPGSILPPEEVPSQSLQLRASFQGSAMEIPPLTFSFYFVPNAKSWVTTKS